MENLKTQPQKNILVVADNGEVLKRLQSRLEEKGYTVSAAQTETEFWNQAFDPQLRLVILDICIRKHLGPDVYRCLLNFSENKKFPVIFTTGLAEDGQPDDMPAGLHEKVWEDGYLFFSHPVSFESLENEIRHLLHESPETPAAQAA